jgi:predicted AlkP superfamily phosphohydrolase/phosphomutase
MPPESNVVWTSLATGMNPGNHGIFDFIMRNPDNYLPYLSLSDISQEPRIFKIGRLKIPLLEPKITKTRRSPAFWEIASERKIPSYTYFCPGSFPPDKVYGKLISGMGVPDIRGTMGTFSFYTTKALEKDKDIGGMVLQVKRDGNIINSFLYGPKNTAKKPAEDIKILFKITLQPESDQIIIDIQNRQITLNKGEWSGWIELIFNVNTFNKVRGICRFYLKSMSPDLELYCSPVNIDPERPPFPISSPKNFSKKLAGKTGLFYTQGMPYDTWALNEQRIDEDVFLEQANMVLEERANILKQEFLEFKDGVFFFYFEYPDSIQHMFWRFQDIEDSRYKHTVLECYKKMDNILGWVMANIDKNAILIVLSDHGFGDFKRSVHLNSWLRDNGFLCLKNNASKSEEFFEGVDWHKTKAYALGFGGIYVNQAGRERYGIVLPGEETEKIKKEIVEKLSQWHDSQTDVAISKKVHKKQEVFAGQYNQDAPDLFVGFNKGFRASWQTALGAAPVLDIENNTKAWQGDHIFDSSLVPGVFFINQKVSFAKTPRVTDIIPTVFNMLGINVENEFDGRSISD